MVQTVPAIPMDGPGDQDSQGGPGGQVVRVVRLATLDDMISENIWFSCPNHQIIEKS